MTTITIAIGNTAAPTAMIATDSPSVARSFLDHHAPKPVLAGSLGLTINPYFAADSYNLFASTVAGLPYKAPKPAEVKVEEPVHPAIGTTNLTAKELDALPEGSRVTDTSHDYWAKENGVWSFTGRDMDDSDYEDWTSERLVDYYAGIVLERVGYDA